VIRNLYRRFAVRHLTVSGPGPHRGLARIYNRWLTWQTRWWPVQDVLGRSWGHVIRATTDQDRTADTQFGNHCEWWFCRRWPDYEIQFRMRAHGREVQEAVLLCKTHAQRYAKRRGFQIGGQTR
jgi:hypothetical protein